MDAILNRKTMHRPLTARRGRALTLTLLIALGVLAATTAMASVYKWADAQGRIHYTDRPPPPDGKLLSVDAGTERPAPYGRPAAASTAAAPPRDPANPSTAAGAARLRQTVDADVAGVRAEQCKQAQDRYQNYIHSRRLYKEGPNKERIYLSDSELETERLNAKRDADDACAEPK